MSQKSFDLIATRISDFPHIFRPICRVSYSSLFLEQEFCSLIPLFTFVCLYARMYDYSFIMLLVGVSL